MSGYVYRFKVEEHEIWAFFSDEIEYVFHVKEVNSTCANECSYILYGKQVVDYNK